MRIDQLKATLVTLRTRIEKAEGEAAYYRSVGNELLSRRMEDERRRLEIEAGHIEHALSQCGEAA